MPPVPTTFLSSYRSEISWPTTTTVPFPRAPKTEPGGPFLAVAKGVFECVFPDVERLVELGVGDHERAEHADAVRVDAGAEEQEAAGGGRVDHCLRELGRRLLRLAVADELDREHGAEAAHVA